MEITGKVNFQFLKFFIFRQHDIARISHEQNIRAKSHEKQPDKSAATVSPDWYSPSNSHRPLWRLPFLPGWPTRQETGLYAYLRW